MNKSHTMSTQKCNEKRKILNIRVPENVWDLAHEKADSFYEGNISLFIREAIKGFKKLKTEKLQRPRRYGLL